MMSSRSISVRRPSWIEAVLLIIAGPFLMLLSSVTPAPAAPAFPRPSPLRSTHQKPRHFRPGLSERTPLVRRLTQTTLRPTSPTRPTTSAVFFASPRAAKWEELPQVGQSRRRRSLPGPAGRLVTAFSRLVLMPVSRSPARGPQQSQRCGAFDDRRHRGGYRLPSVRGDRVGSAVRETPRRTVSP